MGKVRILNTKTGHVKYVMPHIANNTKLMKSYGFIIQDLAEKREVIGWEETRSYAAQLPVITEVFEGDLLAPELPKEKAKPGRKPGTKQKE